MFKRFYLTIFINKSQKSRTISFYDACYQKKFDLMDDVIFELSTKNGTLKNPKGDYHQKWLEETETKLFKQIDDEKRANLIMLRLKKQMNKQ